MIKYFKIIFVFSLLGMFLYACKKDSPEVVHVDFGYNYLPEEAGRYIIYEVDSISYDDVSHPPDTTRYLLKEVIDTIFIDNTGKPAMRIERYYKFHNDTVPYSVLPWTGPRVWFANKSSTDFQKVEENVRYLKLVFPAKEGKQWNGNIYNTLGEKDYEIISADKNEVINSISFDSVLTVKQFEQINFIEYRYESEKYARNVGLVYKERDSIYDGGGQDTIGYTYRQKIISYGK
jgi:hypothetical protein